MRERGKSGDQHVGLMGPSDAVPVDSVRFGRGGPPRLIGGKWWLEGVLGEGATSKVYSATRRHGETPVGAEGHGPTRAAIKMLHAQLANEPEIVEQFFAGGRLCNAVDHPGVVKVLEEGFTSDGVPYLVFELLVGQTLDELRHARGGRVPLDEVMQIADAIMDTLAAVHDKGIVHRDLKPQNILVLDGGGVKLVDFGVAKVRGHTVDAAPHVVGTPSFMPPEQALGMPKKMDAQSDIWALGATLFLLLSGQPVHVARHPSAMLLATASTRPRSLADAAPELPRKIVAVIDRALAYRKAERWPDVRAMRSAWHDAHPAWLPTLPPPAFAPDPTFIEPDLLVPVEPEATRAHTGAIDTPLAMALFDPRELAREAEETSRAPAPQAIPGPAQAHAERPSPPAVAVRGATRRSWIATAGLALTAVLTVGVVAAAIALSADDTPRGSSSRAASAPPPAMELPSAAPSAPSRTSRASGATP